MYLDLFSDVVNAERLLVRLSVLINAYGCIREEMAGRQLRNRRGTTFFGVGGRRCRRFQWRYANSRFFQMKDGEGTSCRRPGTLAKGCQFLRAIFMRLHKQGAGETF